MLERLPRKATKIIQKPRGISYEILNCYKNIDRNIFSLLRKIEGLKDMTIH